MDLSNLPPCGAILAAGGIGTRMAATRPKQFLLLAGEPVLVHTCRALLAVEALQEIVVVTPAKYLEECRQLCAFYLPQEHMGRLVFIPGGLTRQGSVQAGLARLSPALSLILVHDAARPLADTALLYRCLQAAAEHGAAIAALPVTDTLKDVDVTSGQICATIDRSRLWQAQTPQIVRRDLLQMAYDLAQTNAFQGTDEASLLEHAGVAVQVVEGSQKNLKVTHPEDLLLAEALLCNYGGSKSRASKHKTMKIGHGFDAHRLVSGRKLILGGVEIDYHLGLDGHSDADVVSHAFTDAILGALGLGDIGRHFPDNDPQHKGADSLVLLEKVFLMAEQCGMRLGNADITVVCQQPKLMPHLTRMRQNLAHCCRTDKERINIKATTTEKMGYTGRGEGIAAHAVILLEVVHEG
ncbi:MAG: 2-C-methyl-D-erythritol 4-phosphate cytidylyltransferase [Desulfobulbaceae bacterium]|nr:2-C-methyl-D-erythritol 4-phosphate cytidylyltransferase [Desulfobulbaceae bacterium]